MNRSLKSIVCIAASALLAVSVFAGGKKDKTPVRPETDDLPAPAEAIPETPAVPTVPEPAGSVLRVAALNGPSSIPVAYLMENVSDLGDTAVSFEIVAGADVLLPKLLKGEVDIGILPPNVAAKVFNKNNGAVVVGAVVGQGMLNLITKDAQIASLADLKGKKVTVAGQGATPEYLFRYLLERNGIAVAPDGKAADENTVELDFSIPAAEIAAALLSGRIEYAVVPEPFATVAVSKDPSVRRAVNLQTEYAAVEAANGSLNYPMTVVVIRAAAARDQAETVRRFLESYEAAIVWTNANPAKAGVLVQKHSLGLLAPIAAKVIPNGAYVYQSAADARSELENLFTIFMSFAPEAVGGALPADDFYFR